MIVFYYVLLDLNGWVINLNLLLCWLMLQLHLLGAIFGNCWQRSLCSINIVHIVHIIDYIRSIYIVSIHIIGSGNNSVKTVRHDP